MTDDLEAVLDALPQRYPGPGGVAGVVREGRVVAARAWGHASVETGTPMTRATRLPICSISKQFTCAALVAEVGDPSRLDAGVRDFLPAFEGPLPTVRELCDNQSGLRDYWALTVLQGAMAEGRFTREDGLAVLAAMKTGHFAPGTRYSYSNGNFRILSELLERQAGAPLADLYARHIFGPAGMGTAALTPDTARPVDGVSGYEGNAATGFFPAANRIFWIGDAGISASLEDMLAYEAWIDATRDDPASPYGRVAAAPTFRDGRPALYGMGLARHTLDGMALTGHGGALRGFRAQRFRAGSERLSAVVMWNHEADAHGAALSLLRAAAGRDPAAEAGPAADTWRGQWFAPETGLLARVRPAARGATLTYATSPEALAPAADGSLGGPRLRLRRDGTGLRMTRADDGADLALVPVSEVEAAVGTELTGAWHCDEVEAGMEVVAGDGAAAARFTGRLGTGRWERLHPAAPDLWRLSTPRSMDAPAPGDWTVQLHRDDFGQVRTLTIGCWLARGLTYRRTD